MDEARPDEIRQEPQDNRGQEQQNAQCKLAQEAINTSTNRAAAAGATSNPIDRATDVCMSHPENYSTAGQLECLSQAYKAWDAELNKNYQSLKMQLPEKEQADLIQSERQWIKFRDAETLVLNDVYSHTQGTMYGPMRLYDKVDMTRQRAEQLKARLQIVTGDFQ
jgi:uncharacterized protein YecT (DUF1311 family)